MLILQAYRHYIYAFGFHFALLFRYSADATPSSNEPDHSKISSTCISVAYSYLDGGALQIVRFGVMLRLRITENKYSTFSNVAQTTLRSEEMNQTEDNNVSVSR